MVTERIYAERIIVMATFASRLREALDLNHMTAAELHRRTGITEGQISQYLKGDYLAKQDKVFAISQVLGVSPAWLMAFDEPSPEMLAEEVPVMESLAEILSGIKKRSGKVFGDLKSYQIDKGMARYQKETGLGCTLHGLRHGFASILYKHNVDIKTAAYVLGHAQSSTTLEIYTHLMEQDKLASVRSALNSI